MEIREIKLYDCKIDSEIKKIEEEVYSTVGKCTVGDEKIESIVYLEIPSIIYEYIKMKDYKNTTFNMKGIFQVRKNKKGIAYMIFKCNFAISKEDVLDNEMSEKVSNKRIKWTSCIPDLKEKLVDMSADKIKLVEKIHMKKVTLALNKGTYIPIIAIRKLENSDEFGLVMGIKGLLIAKMLNKPVKAYIIECTRDEFLKKLKL